jgi:hypothetical protein
MKKQMKKKTTKKQLPGSKPMVGDVVNATAQTPGDANHQYALNQCYAGLRTMGTTPMVAASLMNEISNGFSLGDIHDAAIAYGDV